MIAVGQYIRTLRKEQRLTRPIVVTRMAERLGYKVDHTTIWRIESGRTSHPHADVLAALVEAVEGDQQEATRLYQDETARATDGEASALAWLRRDQVARIDQIAETMPRDELTNIIEELRAEHQRDPSLVQHLRTFLAGWRGARSR